MPSHPTNSQWQFSAMLNILWLLCVFFCFVEAEIFPRNGTEEVRTHLDSLILKEIVNFMESNHWVSSYSELSNAIGHLWEPSITEINRHHNYTALTDYLQKLTVRYPRLSVLNSIGRTVEGREIWVLTIGRNPKAHLPGRPEVKLIGNMHGNEVFSREAILVLSAVLLHNYGRNEYITKLLEETRIHLLPSMNMDGYEKAEEGDESGVRGRANANGIDLNRNFPAQDDYRAYYHSDNGPPQVETQAVMAWTLSIPFVLSANLHGGTSLVNYPFDDGRGNRALTQDNSLFVFLSYSYARAHRTMYKKGNRCIEEHLNDPRDPNIGIVNGAKWYEVSKGAQDWNYVFAKCFEVTIEMNCVKYPMAKSIYYLWESHKWALIHFLGSVRNSIHGFVLDEQTGKGIWNATVSIGFGPAEVFSYRNGDYWRLVVPGTYEIRFNHFRYFPRTFVVSVTEKSRSFYLNATLRPHSYHYLAVESSVLRPVPFLLAFFFVLFRT